MCGSSPFERTSNLKRRGGSELSIKHKPRPRVDSFMSAGTRGPQRENCAGKGELPLKW